MQLDLFSQENQELNEAYSHLLELDFEGSIQKYQRVLKQNPESKQALQSSILARRWQSIFRQCGTLADADERELFYLEIQNEVPEGEMWNALRRSLLQYLAGAMHEQGIYELNNKLNLGDLYNAVHHPAKAEQCLQEVTNELQQTPGYLITLAEAQFFQDKLNPANKNYLMACWLSPDAELADKIERAELQELIQEVGFRWTPFYGWIRKILPLMNPGEVKQQIEPQSPEQFATYQILYDSEIQRKKKGPKLIEKRKALKERVPEDLFNEYLARVKKEERQLSL